MIETTVGLVTIFTLGIVILIGWFISECKEDS